MTTEPTFQPGDSDLANVWHIFDLARREINRENPNLALEYLSKVREEVDQHEGTLIWAEHRLLLAEAFAAVGNPGAEDFFRETLDSLCRLPADKRTDLELRANEHFGDFLVRAKRPSRARPHYEAARRVALAQTLSEDGARLALRLVNIDLKTDNDSEQENFKSFKRVAMEGGYTCEEQYAAWHQHVGESGAARQGLRVGRNAEHVGDGHFDWLLKSVRKKLLNDEEEKS